ncbi:MAG: hypothetical protein WBG92_23410 [Thiohalocapsa sp.]
MRTHQQALLVLLLATVDLLPTLAADDQDRHILYVNSYHQGYQGSDPITEGVASILDPIGMSWSVIYMDTKRNPSEAFKQAAAWRVKQEIAALQPAVVITSDDNASKYVIAEYYRDAELPFVFCGVNWDASVYGFPYSNVTGMVEVALVPEILAHLKRYAKGERIGFIAGDRLSERKNHHYYISRFGIQFEKTYFVETFAEWKEAFARLQDEVDMVLMTSHAGIPDWEDEEARRFVEERTKIPAGTEHDWEMPYALVGVLKDFREMGEWSARAALEILDGTPPTQIPITANQRGRLMFNARLAARLGIEELPPMAEIYPRGPT